MNAASAPMPAPSAASEAHAPGEALDVLIVGAGFGGLYLLWKLRQQGLVAIAIDAAAGVGGTWYHNRYPGARVDIQSLEYSYSFSEELQQQWHWSERYAAQPELLRYANHVADRFALRDGIRLETELLGAQWDEAAKRWLATVRSVRAPTAPAAQHCSARFLVMASGPLSAPNTPAFPGLESFAGRLLHTARWPHEPVHFSGLRVGVIGTGSSGVQVIPPLAAQASRLTVFQRTPAWVVPAHNGPLDPAWEQRVKADYAGFRERSRRMRPGFGSEHPPHPVSALAADAAEREARFQARWQLGGFFFLGTFFDILLDERANAVAADWVRGRIRAAVHDARVAERLCPTYPIGCKRLCVDSGGYYETFNRPNVELVDATDAPIERITPHGVVVGPPHGGVAGGREFALDALVLATGFDAVTGALTRLDLRGRGGLTMRQKWAAGPLNYLGLTTAGFPNLFHVAGAGSTSAFTSVILSIEHHGDWVAECIKWLDRQGLTTIEAREDAEAAWMAYVLEQAKKTIFLGCNSWYLGANIPGKPRVFMPLTGGFPAYAARCAQVAADGYEGFELA